MGVDRSAPWSERVQAAHALLVRRGHIAPVVAVSTPEGRHGVGDAGLPAEIGSVTKLLTALLLTQMAGAGEVRLDDRVGDLLPAGTPLAPGVADITLEQLASHRSGLPFLPPGLLARRFSRRAMLDPFADVDADRLVDGLARVRLRGRPGRARVRYSNLGVGLLGHLLGRASGVGYEQALTERIVVPLGLTATSFADEPLRQGHLRRGPVPPWHLAALTGAGGLHSSAADLLTFLEQVRDGTGPLAGPIAETLRPRSDRGRMQVGLGWFLLGGGDLLIHNGGTHGARSEVRLERHSGIAVVVLGDARTGTASAAAQLLSPR